MVEEVNVAAAIALESFLMKLNDKISQGIPVGPAASIIVSEIIMADIDRFIIKRTTNYTRYVDDMYIFFGSEKEAIMFRHDLTKYLHDYHRLIPSSEKTFITTAADFLKNHLDDHERKEKESIHEKLNLIGDEYPGPEEMAEVEFEDVSNDEQNRVRGEAYLELFDKALTFKKIDLGVMRHILKKAGRYRLKIILPRVLKEFERLLPVIREVVIYLTAVLNAGLVVRHKDDFVRIINSEALSFPFVNLWIYTLLQNKVFGAVNLGIKYDDIHRIRERALIALRKDDKSWLKEYKSKLEELNPWDKRAVLRCSSVLSRDEMMHWLEVQEKRDDGSKLNKAVIGLVKSIS